MKGYGKGETYNYKTKTEDEKTENANTGKEKISNIKSNEERDFWLGKQAKNKDSIFENKIFYDSKASLENVRWLTTHEAAQYLRISISSIKTMIYRGQVRVHKLGRRNRFLREELERLITLSHTK